MKHPIRWLVLLLITVAASADSDFNPRREGVVVIGVEPDTIAVFIGEGTLSGERFWTSTKIRATFAGVPKGGYIVTRVRANTLMAIRSIRPADRSRPEYWFCGTAFTPTFTVPAGKVVYIGDVTYKWPQGLEPWLVPKDPDFDKARSYIDANFDGLRGQLEPGQFAMMRTRTNCSAKNGSLSYE